MTDKILNLLRHPAHGRGKPDARYPVLEVYELDHREPCVWIDWTGSAWVEDPSMKLPKILFADVPVMIHTADDFSIAPLVRANASTGPAR